MIIGAGIDIVEVSRVRKLREGFSRRFTERVFTAREIDYCRKKKFIDEHLAGRIAAKEAFFKAVGEGFGGLNWKDIEILNNSKGKPGIKLSAKGRKIMNELRVDGIFVSISHSKDFAVSQVILEK